MKKLLLIILSFSVISVNILGCTSEIEEPEGKPLLRFAHYGITEQRDLFVAKEKGFFEENGVNVELIKVDTTAVVPAIIGGSVDGGMSSSITALAAIAAGADIKFVASGARYTKPENLPYVVVLKDSPIETIEDLNGKTISGTSKGSNPWSWVQVAQKENGITFSQYFEAPPGEFQQMMLTGKVDSTIMPAKNRLIIFKEQVKDVLPLAAAAKFGGSGYWFSSEFLQEYPEAVQGFIAALQQAREYERENQMEVLQISDDYVPSVTLEELQALHEAKILTEWPSEVLLEAWQLEFTQDTLIELELLVVDEPIDIDTIVDDRFAKLVAEMPEGELDWLE